MQRRLAAINTASDEIIDSVGAPVSGKTFAAVAHRLSEPAAVYVTETVKFPIDEEHGLVKPASITGRVRAGELSGVVDVPGVAGTNTGDTERFNWGVKADGWPERGVGRNRRTPKR